MDRVSDEQWKIPSGTVTDDELACQLKDATWWASQPNSHRDDFAVRCVLIYRELQRRRAQRCETCVFSSAYDRIPADSYLRCTEIWDAAAEDNREVEKQHSCGWWEARDVTDAIPS